MPDIETNALKADPPTPGITPFLLPSCSTGDDDTCHTFFAKHHTLFNKNAPNQCCMFFKARSQPPDGTPNGYNTTIGNMIFEQVPTTMGARNWICVPDYKNSDTYGIGLVANVSNTLIP